MRRGKAARGLATRGRLWEAAVRTVTANARESREWETVGQVSIPALCPRRKPSVPSCLCVSLRRLWEAAVRTVTANARESREWETVGQVSIPALCPRRLWEAALRTVTANARESREWETVGQVSIPALCPRRKPSVPSCLCVSLRRLWKAALRTVTANNANPREWETVGQVSIPALCPRRKPSVPSCLCVRITFHTKAQRHQGIKTRRKPSVPSCRGGRRQADCANLRGSTRRAVSHSAGRSPSTVRANSGSYDTALASAPPRSGNAMMTLVSVLLSPT